MGTLNYPDHWGRGWLSRTCNLTMFPAGLLVVVLRQAPRRLLIILEDVPRLPPGTATKYHGY